MSLVRGLRPFVLVVGLVGPVFNLAQSATAQVAPSPPLPRITLEEIGVRASFGLLEQDRFLAVLNRPLDAAFMGDRVAVLDIAAPYVRIFDAQGRFVSSAIPYGENPGETRRPYSIASTASGQLLLTHHRGLEWIDASGAVARSLPLLVPDVPSFQQAFRSLGVVEACGADLVLQLEDRRGGSRDSLPMFPVMSFSRTSTSVVRMRTDGALVDTLATFSSTRRESRTYHPWFLDAQPDRLLLYTEENEVNRLVEVGCDGQLLREIQIDSLGFGERVTRMNRGFATSTGQAPYASGLVRVQDRVLWATRVVVDRQGGGQDSLTVVTSIEGGRPARRIAIQGWLQLFDAREDGAVLAGNSWQYGQNWEVGVSWGPSAAVFQLDGNNLIDLIDRRGVPVGPLVPDINRMGGSVRP